MDNISLTFFENGIKTHKIVKYAGRPFRIALSGDGFTEAGMEISGDMGFVAQTEGVKEGSSTFFDFPETPRGLYRFSIKAKGRDGGIFTYESKILVVDNLYKTITPPRGIIYHIFVDRFAKGGSVITRPDAIYNQSGRITQYPEHPGDYVENNEFFGGTIYGIIDKLDYISSLNTEWLYLSPVFKAYSNHKYDVGDFLQVDEMFGGDEALRLLIDECHKRGIKVILDGVFNHVGRDSVYFDYKNLYGGAYHNKDSRYREWFEICDDGTYDCWWGITNLPKIKKIKSYRDFICKRVIPKYMNMGLDGWRLDVVDEYDNDFLEEITSATKGINPDAVIIGEVWEDVTEKVAYSQRKSYFYGAALDSATNYPVREGIIKYFQTGNAVFLRDVLENQLKYYPDEKLFLMLNMLGSHDTVRIINILSGYDGNDMPGSYLSKLRLTPEQREKGKRLFLAAYTLLACLPGIPAIYYGDEAGLEGWRDPFNRQMFPWGKEDKEITDYIRKINAIRFNSKALTEGKTHIIQSNDGFFAFEREYGNYGKIFCVCNMSEKYIYHVNGGYVPLNLAENNVRPGQTGIFGVC
jgi:cyclomaltodextrinase